MGKTTQKKNSNLELKNCSTNKEEHLIPGFCSVAPPVPPLAQLGFLGHHRVHLPAIFCETSAGWLQRKNHGDGGCRAGVEASLAHSQGLDGMIDHTVARELAAAKGTHSVWLASPGPPRPLPGRWSFGLYHWEEPRRGGVQQDTSFPGK